MTDFNDPASRLALAERVGPEEYNRRMAEHIEASTITTVAGHKLRPVQSRFGRLIMVGETKKAFLSMDEAKAYAEANPA